MNEQSRATLLAAAAPAATATEDAWDRLAALAYGAGASEGGCSEHAHDCACLATHGAARTVRTLGAVAALTQAAPPPDEDRPVDPEEEPGAEPEDVPDPDRPVFTDPDPEQTPPLSPEPDEDEGATGI